MIQCFYNSIIIFQNCLFVNPILTFYTIDLYFLPLNILGVKTIKLKIKVNIYNYIKNTELILLISVHLQVHPNYINVLN